MKYVKYPRTLHLPWSLGVTNDDKVLKDISHFIGKRVIVTEKMDGENSTLYPDYLHARSIDSKDHPSRHWLKQLHSYVKDEIPEGWRVCGENVFAEHSIKYDSLSAHFIVFSIWDNMNICLSWDETIKWIKYLGLNIVPILYDGIWDEKKIKECFLGKSKFGQEQEGYVVRLADSFHYDGFSKRVAKFVRKNHVQTDDHWMQKELVVNKLIKGVN